ncbi:MAG: gluconokinase [Paenibacillus sp.]|nr:gluconokinase [Paenibacillus sp.]
MTVNCSSKRYVVAADIGTTSTKTLVIDRDGRVIAGHSIEYPLYTPTPDRAEQDPLEIFAAVVRGIREVIAKAGISGSDVLCVSFSSAMHSLIAVDRELQPLTRCITWADNRSADLVAPLKNEMNGMGIYRNTGTPIHPMSPLLKLMWMNRYEPELVNRTYKFIGIKEFVFAKLFGKFVIDYSLASCTGLFNLRQLEWDEEALRIAGVSRDQLSEPVSTTHIETGLSSAYAVEMGLPADTPFVVGASDGVLANLGVGAFEPGVYAARNGQRAAYRSAGPSVLLRAEGRLLGRRRRD